MPTHKPFDLCTILGLVPLLAALVVGVPSQEMTLETLEAALMVEPNNLRYGAEYRQRVIAAAAYDRCLAFFEKLTTDHPQAANAFLNRGFAVVDKIPVEGAITQVVLANVALGHFSKAIELEESWLGRYTRGNSYLFWPTIFGRTPLGIADLERAIEIGKTLEKKPYHARAWVALGDGHWRLADHEKARQVWLEGRQLFPDDPDLKTRLELQGEALDAHLEANFDPSRRVDTTLREIFETE